MNTIRIGIIGWGFMGKTHAHALRAIPLYYPGADFVPKIQAVCSRRLEMARQGAEILDAPFWTEDYRKLLERDDIDAVSICTPNAQHEEMAIAALAAGKHIYIDKPLAVTAESAARIAEAAKRHPECVTQMVFNNRYFPSTMRAKALVEEGRIGDVLSFHARYLHSGSIDPSKAIGWKQQLQGGVLLDLGSHVLDLLTYLVGYPEGVLASQRTLYAERPTKDGGRETRLSEDHILSILRLKNGALGTVEASKIATGANDEFSLEIRGTKGALIWDGMQADYLRFYDNTLPEAPLGGERGFTAIESVARFAPPGGTFLPPKNSIGWDRGHIHCYYSFLDHVNRGEQSENGIQEGARLQALMDAISKSAREGRWMDAEAN